MESKRACRTGTAVSTGLRSCDPNYRCLFLTFEEEFRAHADRSGPSPCDLILPKIVDWDEDAGRFTYDEDYARKHPDWTCE